jgi:hypothetical protein
MRQFSEQATSALPQTIGQATIFQDRKPTALDQLAAAQKYKADQAIKQKAARDKEVADKLKYAPDAIWHPFTQEHEAGVNDILNHQAQLSTSGEPLDYNNPNFQEFQKKKFDLQQNVSKAEDIKKNYYEIINNKNPYTNQNVVFSKLNDYVIGQPGGRKKTSEIDVPEMYNTLRDPETLATTEMTQDFVKSIPEKVNQIVKTRGINVGADQGVYFDEVKEASKFYSKGPDGKLQINITPETKEIFKGMDPRVEGYIQMQLQKPENKNKSEDDIIKEMISPFAYTNNTVNRSGITKESKDGNGSDKDLSVTSTFDQERNVNLSQDEENPDVRAAWVPHEMRLDGKKMDKPILLNSKRYLDEETNKVIDKQIGEKPVKITRMQLRPVAAKDYPEHKIKKGQIIQTTKENNFKSPIEKEYRWFVAGTYDEGDGDEKVSKKILIPYDDAKTDLKAAYGIDLDQRPPSEYSDVELVQFVKDNYPKLTPEQKKAKYDQLRSIK